MSQAKATIDPDTIKEWVEARGGHPAAVKRTESKNDVGILRIDYPGFSGERSLEEISWDEFFEKFEAAQLAFLYQDESDSRFSKLVSRESVQDKLEQGGPRARHVQRKGRTHAGSHR